ncbi:MAG: hypothetical protein HYX94_09860 [Chloroflexi bacterium]|nr:hypothetical protein [Chloroflexota bacterium]
MVHREGEPRYTLQPTGAGEMPTGSTARMDDLPQPGRWGIESATAAAETDFAEDRSAPDRLGLSELVRDLPYVGRTWQDTTVKTGNL